MYNTDMASSCFLYTESYANLLGSPFWSIFKESLSRDSGSSVVFSPNETVQKQVQTWLIEAGLSQVRVFTIKSFLNERLSILSFNPNSLILSQVLEEFDFSPFQALAQTQGFYLTCQRLFNDLDEAQMTERAFLAAHGDQDKTIAEHMWRCYEAFKEVRSSEFPDSFWPLFDRLAWSGFKALKDYFSDQSVFFVGFCRLKRYEERFIQTCIESVKTSSFLLPYQSDSLVYKVIEPTVSFIHSLPVEVHIISVQSESEERKATVQSCPALLDEFDWMNHLDTPATLVTPSSALWSYTASARQFSTRFGLSLPLSASPFLTFLSGLTAVADSRFSRRAVLAFIKGPFVHQFHSKEGTISRFQPDLIAFVASDLFIRQGFSNWMTSFSNFILSVQTGKASCPYTAAQLTRQKIILEELFTLILKLSTAESVSDWQDVMETLLSKLLFSEAKENASASQKALYQAITANLKLFCIHSRYRELSGTELIKQFALYLKESHLTVLSDESSSLSSYPQGDGFFLPFFDHLIVPQAHQVNPIKAHGISYLNITLGKELTHAWFSFVTHCWLSAPRLTLLAPRANLITWLPESRVVSVSQETLPARVSHETFANRPYLTPWIAFRMAPKAQRLSAAAQALFLEQLEKRPLSATALELYQSCPRRYFYQYGLGLKEDKGFQDDVSPAKWGTFIHEFLYQLFTTYPDLNPSEEQLLFCAKTCFKQVAGDDLNWELKREFFFGTDTQVGFLSLLLSFLKDNPFPLPAAKFEHPFKATFELENGLTLPFKGIIDVVLQSDSQMAILDYKTGKHTASGQACLSFKSLQLPLYMLAARQSFPDKEMVGSLIYQVRDGDYLKKKVVSATVEEKKTLLDGNRSRPMILKPDYFNELVRYISSLYGLLRTGFFSTQPISPIDTLIPSRPSTLFPLFLYRQLQRRQAFFRSLLMLTPSQRQAVYTTQNSLIEAGAGSGKTTVLVSRYIQLVEDKGVEPSDILAITFTDKSAQEMLERIHKKLPHPDLERKALVMTFHAFCRWALNTFPLYAGVDPTFTVLDASDAALCFEEALIQTLEEKAIQKDATFKSLKHQFSSYQIRSILKSLSAQRLKVESWLTLQDGKKIDQEALAQFTSVYTDIMASYTRLKESKLGLDYDDLILKTQALLNHDAVRHSLQKRFKSIMIDEFQDTDELQWDIMQKLCDDGDYLQPKKLFLVGDYKQSIYRFRGATPHLMQALHHSFQDNSERCEVIQLSENFRSSKAVLEPLNTLFSPLFNDETLSLLPYQALNPQQTFDGKLHFAGLENAKNADEEAIAIGHHVLSLFDSGMAFKDMAILTRRRKELLSLESHLTALNIPIQHQLRLGFYQQDCIVTLYTLLMALGQSYNDSHWVGVLESELFGISDSALYCLMSQVEGFGILDKLSAVLKLNHTFAHTHGLIALDFQILQFSAHRILNWVVRADTEPLIVLLKEAVESCALFALFEQGPEKAQKIDDCTLYLDQIQAAELKQQMGREALLTLMTHKFKDTSAAFQEESEGGKGLKLITIHSSKGLGIRSCYYPPPTPALLSSRSTSLGCKRRRYCPKRRRL